MPTIVTPTQLSFIKDRSTQDNIFLIKEVLHSLRSKKKNKVGCMVMKLYLEKSYDKVSWNFLEETLLAFHFPLELVETYNVLRENFLNADSLEWGAG